MRVCQKAVLYALIFSLSLGWGGLAWGQGESSINTAETNTIVTSDDVFLASQYQIPADLGKRKEFFVELTNYQKHLIDQFFVLGDNLNMLNKEKQEEIEKLKNKFLKEAENARIKGWYIVNNNKYTNKDLFDYQEMVKECDNLLNKASALF